MKTNLVSSAAFVAFVAASAVGVHAYTGGSSPPSSPASASSPAITERSTNDTNTEHAQPLGPTRPGEQDQSVSQTFTVRFPEWLDPDRMEDAVTDAGAKLVATQPALGEVVASVTGAQLGEVVTKLQGDPRVEEIRTSRPQLLH